MTSLAIRFDFERRRQRLSGPETGLEEQAGGGELWRWRTSGAGGRDEGLKIEMEFVKLNGEWFVIRNESWVYVLIGLMGY